MKSLETIIDEWEHEVIKHRNAQLVDYLNQYLTKAEANRHSDNLFNLQVDERHVAQLKMELLLAGLLKPEVATAPTKLATKPHLVLLKDNVGDWAALYVDGKCTSQGHSIHKDEILDALQERGVISYQEVECETEDRFPQELPADLTQLPGYIA